MKDLCFSQENLLNREYLFKMDSKVIFILGAPRSGTTFLASILEYTIYGVPFETHFITKYYKRLKKYGDLNKYKNYKRLVTDILRERPVMQWGLNFNIDANYQKLAPNIHYKDIVNQICSLAVTQKGGKYWGDKTPHYLKDLEIIYKLYPEAKYIFIVRDGRDVAVSLLKKPWGPNNIYSCAKYWNSIHDNEGLLMQLKNNNQLYMLRYEDLLDDVAMHTLNIYQFLEEVITSDSIDCITNMVIRKNYKKWKHELTLSQIKLFEQIAGNRLTSYGYKITHVQSDVSIWKKIFYSSQNIIYLYKHLFIINVIDGLKIRYFGKEPFAE